jgi:hypothetical protein
LRYSAGTEQPAELVFPLRREQFDLLCEGETMQQELGLCIATFITSVGGLIGLLATIDWTAAFAQKKVFPFVWTALFAVVALASGLVGGLAYTRSSGKGRSGYSRVKAKIAEFFQAAER